MVNRTSHFSRAALPALLRRLTWGLLATLLPWGCRPQAPTTRLPTAQEADGERVIANYRPPKLRILPTTSAGAPAEAPPQGYLLLGSELPGLPALFRPLAVTSQKPPPGMVPRAATLTWVAGAVLESALPSPPSPLVARFLRYDRDARLATPSDVALPAACSQLAERPPLLISDGGRVYAAVRCPAERRAILLTLDSQARLLSARVVERAEPTELFFHQPDADYLLAGRQLLRVAADGQGLPTIGTVPPPGDDGSGESRELLRSGPLLLVVDGAVGRVIGMDATRLDWSFEKHFYTGGTVRRLRATLVSPHRLLIVTAEADAAKAQPPALFGTALPIADARGDASARLQLGVASESGSDHELVPIAASSGGGALLLLSHQGNSGPLVALRRLSF